MNYNAFFNMFLGNVFRNYLGYLFNLMLKGFYWTPFYKNILQRPRVNNRDIVKIFVKSFKAKFRIQFFSKYVHMQNFKRTYFSKHILNS